MFLFFYHSPLLLLLFLLLPKVLLVSTSVSIFMLVLHLFLDALFARNCWCHLMLLLLSLSLSLFASLGAVINSTKCNHLTAIESSAGLMVRVIVVVDRACLRSVRTDYAIL